MISFRSKANTATKAKPHSAASISQISDKKDAYLKMLKKEKVEKQQENFWSNGEFLSEIGIRHSRGKNYSVSPSCLKRNIGPPGTGNHLTRHNEDPEASLTNELKSAVAEEWLRFLKSRLQEMEEGEVEHHNVKVIGFCWPKEMLEFLS